MDAREDRSEKSPQELSRAIDPELQKTSKEFGSRGSF
jgi:hypothetical protein